MELTYKVPIRPRLPYPAGLTFKVPLLFPPTCTVILLPRENFQEERKAGQRAQDGSLKAAHPLPTQKAPPLLKQLSPASQASSSQPVGPDPFGVEHPFPRDHLRPSETIEIYIRIDSTSEITVRKSQ